MSTAIELNEYIFLMRGADWDEGLSPREAQDGLTKMMAWIENLRLTGVLLSGQPLVSHGTVVKADRKAMITDGPFAESKEAVGGYLVLRAESLEAAVEIAKQCPSLRYGLFIEVRPIVVACPMTDRLESELSLQSS